MTFSSSLVRQFLKMFLLVTAATLFVYILLDFVGNIRVWLLREPEEVFEYYLNYAPQIIYLVMPVNLLLSIVGTVGGMARHLEITSMKVAGRSVLRITFPLMVLGALTSGVMFWMAEEVLPDANHRRLELAQPPTDQASKIQRDKFKMKAVVVGEGTTYYFRNYSAHNERGRDVVVFRFDSLGVTDRWDASTMEWDGGGWVLRDGFHRQFFSDGESRGANFDRFDLEDRVTELPGDFLDNRFSPDEMSRPMLLRKIETQRRSGENTRMLETQYHFKLAGSLVGFLIVILGIALSHGAIRGGLPRLFGIGLFFTFNYYILLRVGLVFGENGALSPLIGAWFGNGIVGAFAAIFLLRSVRL